MLELSEKLEKEFNPKAPVIDKLEFGLLKKLFCSPKMTEEMNKLEFQKLKSIFCYKSVKKNILSKKDYQTLLNIFVAPIKKEEENQDDVSNP